MTVLPALPDAAEVRAHPGDLSAAARMWPGVFVTCDAPHAVTSGVRVLAYLGGPAGAVSVNVTRDFEGFSLHGEAVAPTRYRPREVARAVSFDGEAWEATLLRARRLAAQLERWLAGELALDGRARDLGALARWRRGQEPPVPVEVGGTQLSWCPRLECWACVDTETGEVTRLTGEARTVYDLALAGAGALSLAGQAWAYSLHDGRTPVAVCAENGGHRARRAATIAEGEIVAYHLGAQVPKGRRVK